MSKFLSEIWVAVPGKAASLSDQPCVLLLLANVCVVYCKPKAYYLVLFNYQFTQNKRAQLVVLLKHVIYFFYFHLYKPFFGAGSTFSSCPGWSCSVDIPSCCTRSALPAEQIYYMVTICLW